MNVALLLPNWIGDVVMATPALRAIRKHYGPEARIVGLMRPYVGKVLDGTDWLNDAIYYDHRSKDEQKRGPAVLKKLREFSPDTIVSFTHSLRGAWLGWRSGAKQRVGFARNGTGLFLNHVVTRLNKAANMSHAQR